MGAEAAHFGSFTKKEQFFGDTATCNSGQAIQDPAMPLPEIKIFFDHIHLTKLDSFDLIMGMFNAELLLWLFTLSWTGWIGKLGTVEVDVGAFQIVMNGNVANRLQGRCLVFDVQKS